MLTDFNPALKTEHKLTVKPSFSTTDRDRPVSVTKLCSQISYPSRTLLTVPLILTYPNLILNYPIKVLG
jgi:hypothetical protein